MQCKQEAKTIDRDQRTGNISHKAGESILGVRGQTHTQEDIGSSLHSGMTGSALIKGKGSKRTST